MSDSRHPSWDIKSFDRVHEVLSERVESAWRTIFSASDDDQLAFLKDTRAIHKFLFMDLTPEGFESYAGTYRGQKGSVLEHRGSAVHYDRNIVKDIPELGAHNVCLAPAEVAGQMAALGQRIEEIFKGAEEMGARDYFSACVSVMAPFLLTHPYLDGNGHISRFVFSLLMRRKGISPKQDWRIHPKPYRSSDVGIGLVRYKDNPQYLVREYEKWFEV